MNIQDFILIIILLVCIIWIVKRIILCYRQISKENDPCKGCKCSCNAYSKTLTDEKKCVFIEKKAENACGFKK